MRLKKIMTIIIIVLGMGLISYPYISNYIYENSAKSTISSFEEKAGKLSKSTIKSEIELAKKYNIKLREKGKVFTDPFAAAKDQLNATYFEILSINKEGLMGYIEIPTINTKLPIYHSSTPKVLEKGAGHLQGSSLPVGGKGTHAVITGHTGLNNAKMFTDLTQMEEDDYFYIHVLNRTLAYRVYDIDIIEPDDISRLSIINEKDYITLITCTPYGVNSHRLLVMGERARTDKIPQKIDKKHYISQWQTDYLKSILIGLFVSLVFIICCLVRKELRKKKDLEM